jgi:hypothetical protein
MGAKLRVATKNILVMDFVEYIQHSIGKAKFQFYLTSANSVDKIFQIE